MQRTKSFKSRVAKAGDIPDIMMITLFVIYTFCFSGIIQDNGISIKAVTFVLFPIFFFNLIFLSPTLDHLVSKRLSIKLSEERSDTFSKEERTKLIKSLMIFPLYEAIAFGILYSLDTVLILWILKLAFHIDLWTLLFTGSAYLFALVIDAVARYIFVENICSATTKKLLQKDIDIATIKKDRFYGLSLYVRVFFHIILPFSVSTLTQCCFLIKAKNSHFTADFLHGKMFLMLILNMTAYLFLAIFFFHHISKTLKGSMNLLESLNKNEKRKDAYIPTDLGYELEFNTFLIDELLKYLENTAKQFGIVSSQIYDSTKKLADISLKNTEITMNERAGVTECLAIMEERKRTFASDTEKLNNIRLSAQNTQDSVLESSALLKAEINKMSEITEMNLKTISNIKSLSEKIDDVQKTLSYINVISERNKMIAFNAEIKASITGDKGRNFHIIANELRRLVSTITVSTQSIKENIKDIQETADNLIISSEGGTQRIRDGSKSFNNLEESFDELQISSTVTTESAETMQNEMNELYESFSQIYESLNQMSITLYEFDNTTKSINNSSEKLKETAEQLNTINKEEES